MRSGSGRGDGGVSWRTSSGVLFKHAVMSALPFSLLASFCLVPGVSKSIFAAWGCDQYQLDTDAGTERSFLQEDLRIVCRDSEHGSSAMHEKITNYALMFIAIWPVGLPCSYALLLFRCRTAIRQRRETALARATRFLHREYNPEFYFWEVLPLMQRLIISGWLLLIPAHYDAWRIFVGLLTAVGYLTLLQFVRPYKRAATNAIAIAAQFSLVCVFLGGTFIKVFANSNDDVDCGSAADGDNDKRNDDAVMRVVAIMIFFNFLVLLLFFTLAAYQFATRDVLPSVRFIATRHLPELRLKPSQTWHIFLSHIWSSGQDQMASVKRQLLLLLPGVRCFLDVDDLEENVSLDKYVKRSLSILIFLSKGYFSSGSCKKEVTATLTNGNPIILLHEADPARGGAPLEKLRDECPSEWRDNIFGVGAALREVTTWFRVKDFQLVSLKMVVSLMLRHQGGWKTGWSGRKSITEVGGAVDDIASGDRRSRRKSKAGSASTHAEDDSAAAAGPSLQNDSPPHLTEAAEVSPAPSMPPSPPGDTELAFGESEVAAWLKSIGKAKYVESFSQSFDTLADLRLSANELGISAVLEECAIKGMGDKTVMERALKKLLEDAPRNSGSSDEDFEAAPGMGETRESWSGSALPIDVTDGAGPSEPPAPVRGGLVREKTHQRLSRVLSHGDFPDAPEEESGDDSDEGGEQASLRASERRPSISLHQLVSTGGSIKAGLVADVANEDDTTPRLSGRPSEASSAASTPRKSSRDSKRNSMSSSSATVATPTALLGSELYVPGEVTHQHLDILRQTTMFVSDHNPGARMLAVEMAKRYSQLKLAPVPDNLAAPKTGGGHRAEQPHAPQLRLRFGQRIKREFYLLYLNESTFLGEAGAKLADEVRAARAVHTKVILAHECDPQHGGCEFSEFFKTCPEDLIGAGLFARIAVAFHPSVQHRAVSYCLLAKDLGASRNKLRTVIAARADEKAAAVTVVAARRASSVLAMTSRRQSTDDGSIAKARRGGQDRPSLASPGNEPSKLTGPGAISPSLTRL
jgi:hypothetical protein